MSANAYTQTQFVDTLGYSHTKHLSLSAQSLELQTVSEPSTVILIMSSSIQAWSPKMQKRPKLLGLDFVLE